LAGQQTGDHWGALSISGGGFVADEERWTIDIRPLTSRGDVIITKTSWSRISKAEPVRQIANSAACPALKLAVAELQAVPGARSATPEPLETVWYQADVGAPAPLFQGPPLHLRAANSGTPLALWMRRVDHVACWVRDDPLLAN
jgi:hypothetical protein